MYPKTPETTNSPIPEEPTPPIVITVSVTEETATVKGHKNYDGSVVVDTNKVPKDKWTVINQKPTDCQAGFEMDDYGACFGKWLFCIDFTFYIKNMAINYDDNDVMKKD